MQDRLVQDNPVKDNPIVDVVIPTYKPGNELKKLVERLMKQECKIHKIIIVNTLVDGLEFPVLDSVQGEKIERFDIPQEEFNHGLTRNYGMEQSDADYVVFMTQDAIPADSKLITELIRPFADEDVYVSYARQLPRKNCKYVESYVRSFNYPAEDVVKTKEDFDTMGIKTIFCSDVCAAYRRDRHQELGGFPKTNFNEDMIFAYKTLMAGKKVYYASKAKVVHSHNYTYFQQYRRNVEIGKSQMEFKEIFGTLKSENEGVRMIKGGIMHLIKKGKWYLIPDLILSSGFKFIGYRVGKRKGRIQ